MARIFSPESPHNFKRIGVIGCTGSGKSTFAKELANLMHIPCMELDSIHWKPDWNEAPHEVTRQKVNALVQTDSFVVDGNYGFLRDIIWPRLQVVFWLDYPLPRVIWQLWGRTFRRVFSKELLWGTNIERFWPQFFSKDSLFLWALKTHRRHRKLYPILFSSQEYNHLQVYHFRNPGEARFWLDNFASE